MDCKEFRNQHLAYLDDTLSGDQMSLAQRHVLACDRCAAHDTLVRRSLMVARSLPTIEPSSAFHERLQARLATCRNEPIYAPEARSYAAVARTMAVLAAGTVIGALAWHGIEGRNDVLIAMQPVVASQPAPSVHNSYITPALMQAMATGNPVLPAALLIEDAPTYFVSAHFR